MTTVGYASSVRPNGEMLPKAYSHDSKEEETLTPTQLVSVLRRLRHVAISSMRKRLFHLQEYLLREVDSPRQLPPEQCAIHTLQIRKVSLQDGEGERRKREDTSVEQVILPMTLV